MKTSFPGGVPRGFAYAFVMLLSLSSTQAATNKKPQLISQDTNTRAIALESITMRAEPFGPTMTVPYGTDLRTRVCIFAMNLELLPGEGMNAFTADVQDATGKLYPLRVEYVGQVPNFPGITMIIVRLADDLGDVGDVLLRINLHGIASNRVSRLDIQEVDQPTTPDQCPLPRRRHRHRPIRH